MSHSQQAYHALCGLLDANAFESKTEWVHDNHLYEFANCISPIAAGMQALALHDSKNEYVRYVWDCDTLSYPGIRNMGRGGYIIIVINPPHRGCGCNMPEGGDIFGQYGTLGLQAVVLGISPGKDHFLSLAMRLRDGSESAEYGYSAVNINLNGNTIGENQYPYLKKNGQLYHSLGMISADQAYGVMMSMGGSLDSSIGFPGGKEYLAKHIHKLGPYLSAMAEQIGEHQH